MTSNTITHLEGDEDVGRSEFDNFIDYIRNEEENPEEQEEGIIEQYRLIKDLPNYSISNLGQVRNNKTGRILKPLNNGNGYLFVHLCDGHQQKHKTIHTLVAEAFYIKPNETDQVDHRDRNKLNNCVDNLRYVSRSDNNKNRASQKGVIYELVDDLPGDCFIVFNYGKHEFDNLHYSPENEKFYIFTGVEYRALPILRQSNTHFLIVNVVDTNGHQTSICLNKFKRLYNIE
jgi:hypothetical protein